jgi:SPP1 gp7 family putative phage head morphogenesis protein
MAISKKEVIEESLKARRELIRANDRALRDLTRLYDETYKTVNRKLKEVTSLIETSIAEGVEVNPSWLFMQGRYLELIAVIRQELTLYGLFAASAIRSSKESAIALAGDHAMRLAGLQLPDIATWSRPAFEATESLITQLVDGSPLSYKFAELPAFVAEGIRGAIEQGFLLGDSPRKIARDIKRAYGDGLTNTLLTCRTEVMRAYRIASAECYQANEPVMRGWVWVSARDQRTCSACWGMDGTFHKITEVMSSHPACRCVPVPVTKSYADLGIEGVEDTAAPAGWDATGEFDALPEAAKQKILGVTKLRLYNEGKIGIRDLPVRERSNVWGDTYRPVTLKELVEGGKVSSKDI